MFVTAVHTYVYTGNLGPETWCSGTWNLGTWKQGPEYWDLCPGIWELALETLVLSPGTSDLVPGNKGLGIRALDLGFGSFGPGTFEPGICCCII